MSFDVLVAAESVVLGCVGTPDVDADWLPRHPGSTSHPSATVTRENEPHTCSTSKRPIPIPRSCRVSGFGVHTAS